MSSPVGTIPTFSPAIAPTSKNCLIPPLILIGFSQVLFSPLASLTLSPNGNCCLPYIY